ncbi:hypothetical protein TPHA_0A01760 [Tetrapisispora phaffii CBS 4417]|uniref:STAS domain-containing protein n=1 Tax=Tetrapisispora phaffii (strain ATCC 24235 / CBS 4417 / NBRC 1672 / NRRL Y-8282 / UCD 70-5) TaxID=1071381 RepID=G8BMY1_TETPH|nr:hypothetical protein TPHA_0A01760 [Tetrapisispora phaffii CBS 4417]CCE61259.1 hypothetical protein TPHA_0A01760 [Tetrapisispora phaffii CBS 4417]
MTASINGSIDLERFELEYDHGKRGDDTHDRVEARDLYSKVDIEEVTFQCDNYSGRLDVNSSLSIPMYNEKPVTIKDFYYEKINDYFSIGEIVQYLTSLFPLLKWLPHYNLDWLIQDLIAGITVGCVLVPQSMSYAQIATLAPQYGLYSSFIGAFIYSFFATSKDVCIGPVAVMSLQTAKVIERVTSGLTADEQTIYTAPIIATALALLCGIISTGIGFLRLGFLIEFISLNAVAGFMTGSAFNIICGQVPALMGYNKKVNTRASTYEVVINTLKHLPDTKLDAVFGLIPLSILYLCKWFFSSLGPQYLNKLSNRRNLTERQRKIIKYLGNYFFYSNAMRNGVVIIVFTAISWAITRGKSSTSVPISILGTVPKGLKEVAVFKVPGGLFEKLAPDLPSSIIILLLEHIAISKSFGRVNDYKIVPDQELIAIGVTNLIGTFFMAYPATGSFSRSALKAKCDVKTPLSGLFSGACVLLALYCLTGAFYYIPKATLSAVIIHAVSDLLASYKTTLNFYKMNPLDFVCFITTVFITVFSSIEYGIYFAICFSCAQLIFKNMFPVGSFLGYIKIAEVLNPTLSTNDYTILLDDSSSVLGEENTKDDSVKNRLDQNENPKSSEKEYSEFKSYEMSSNSKTTNLSYYVRWVPMKNDYHREVNPLIKITPPPPGIIVYRFGDSFTYLNCSRHYDIIYDEVKKNTRKGISNVYKRKQDRPWNDVGEWECPKSLKNLFNKFKKKTDIGGDEDKDGNEAIESNSKANNTDNKPELKIICFDFSQVVQTDATAIQSLNDLRKAVNRYSNKQIEYHFSGIISAWVKKSLIEMGFGTVNDNYSDKSIIIGHQSYHVSKINNQEDGLENQINEKYLQPDGSYIYHIQTVTGTNYPFFHIDIPDFSNWEL